MTRGTNGNPPGPSVPVPPRYIGHDPVNPGDPMPMPTPTTPGKR